MRKRYGYDTSYLDMMLKESPSAFFKLASVVKAARHREVVPVDASFTAGLVGALAEDCGPCTQICVDMALEAGMPKDQIEAVLRRDPRAMNSATEVDHSLSMAIDGDRIAAIYIVRNPVKLRHVPASTRH